MIQRPSQRWRQIVDEEKAEVAAGTRPEATSAEFWPAHFTDAVDAVLADYEQRMASIDVTADDAVWQAVERVVLALNEVDEPEGLIESGERDELYEFIERVLTTSGVDVPALLDRAPDDRELTAGRTW